MDVVTDKYGEQNSSDLRIWTAPQISVQIDDEAGTIISGPKNGQNFQTDLSIFVQIVW